MDESGELSPSPWRQGRSVPSHEPKGNTISTSIFETPELQTLLEAEDDERDANEAPKEPEYEASPVSEAQMKGPYKLSKWQAEQIALEYYRKGVPVVIVNPSAPVGPRK